MNRNNLIPFDFEQHIIRTLLDENGDPWFVATDVAGVLDYSSAEIMTRRLDDDEKQIRQFDVSNPRGMIVINESGLYTVILRSNKESAKPFRRWVTHEVLPSIRKTGQYQRMINQFLLADPRDWERLFPFDYYYELCRVCGFSYEKHRPLPWIIGRLTWDLVYKRSLPVEVLDVLRDWKNTPEPGGRRRLPKPLAEGELEKPYRRSEKLHQLLTLKAADALVRRIDKVVIIARQSTDQRDLRARDNLDFGSANTQLCLRFPYEGGERLQLPRSRTRTNGNRAPTAIVHADLFVG